MLLTLDTSVNLFEHFHLNGKHEPSSVGSRAVDIYIQWAPSCLIADFLKLSAGRREINRIVMAQGGSVSRGSEAWFGVESAG